MATTAGCSPQATADEKALFRQQDSTLTHIGFINQLPENDPLSILDYHYYYNGAGVAAGDVNNDGLPDLLFVSNRGKNKLYLNKGKRENGSFDFEDISAAAGIEGFADWQSGITMADVNSDGLLDIYICAVSGYKGLEGRNELYINLGPDADGLITFSEQAAAYGLDFSGYSTQAAFFDYDQDGDLDMYLLNHAVHTTHTYGRASTRSVRDAKSGDVLFENQLINKDMQQQDGAPVKFQDVSEQAGIYQALMGYGLGIVIADLNNDGWDDVYVANDFHEDDYYYINNGNGTFTESVKEHFGHLSRFSMGCDAADINNDGFPDLMTLDMYPEDEKVQKASLGEDPFEIFLYKLSYGYFPQYSRNTLQLSLSGKKFTDIGVMAGVAATDWSWTTLMADFDNDGQKDIFVANGIVKRPNDQDYVNFVSGSSGNLYGAGRNPEDRKASGALMPSGEVPNYLFRGTENMKFEDKSAEWGFSRPSLSNGAVYADLDGDGDLDLVVNNINEPAGIFENRHEQFFNHHYLKVKLVGAYGNAFGTGAKVFIKQQGALQFQQLNPTRGFLSSVEPILNFGLGSQSQVDTLIVIWGNQKAELRTGIQADTTLVLTQTEATEKALQYQEILFPGIIPLFEELHDPYLPAYTHEENRYYDFYRESLIPFMLSTEGPGLATGDVNGDGLDDFYVGGARFQAGQLFIQQADGRFKASGDAPFHKDTAYEDVDAVFFDANGNGHLDLYVASGGNEFYGQQDELLDRLYLNDGRGNFSRSTTGLPTMYENTACVRPYDFDGDGDLDLFVGSRVVGARYGYSPDSYLLINDGKGNFSDMTDQLAPSLRGLGMVTDAQWVDIDLNGTSDLLVVGDWMPVKVFVNQGNTLTDAGTLKGLEQSNGLWQTIQAADFDGDGDVDFILGNLGTNSKLRKSENAGLRLWVKDILGRQKPDPILAYELDDKWYPVATRDELGKQLPLVKKKFSNYTNFAGKTVEEIFDEGELESALVLNVNKFESVYLENLRNQQFKQHVLPKEAQQSKIFAFHIDDFDGDGQLDVLLGGNLHGVSTFQGRYDGSYGLMLKGDNKGNFDVILPTDCGFVLEGEVRNIKPLRTASGEMLLVARNNMPLQLFRRNPGFTAHR